MFWTEDRYVCVQPAEFLSNKLVLLVDTVYQCSEDQVTCEIERG